MFVTMYTNIKLSIKGKKLKKLDIISCPQTYTVVGQEAAKISEAKNGCQKKFANTAGFESAASGVKLNWQILFRSPSLTSNIFAAP